MKLTPIASMRTRACPASGFGASTPTYSRTSGPPVRLTRIAFMWRNDTPARTLSAVTSPIPDESSRFGEYEVETLIGKGSIGKVYLARHRRIGRRVALKTGNLEQRFEDE